MNNPIVTSTFRASSTPSVTSERLGPLSKLPGTWVGKGFNLISLPNRHNENKPLPFCLKLNLTHETLTFTSIGAPIPNRGFRQDDIFFLGLHYIQQVSDAQTNEGLHIEPGIWLNLPATSQPSAPRSLVRLATVPHGDSLLAVGPVKEEITGAPTIARADPIPFTLDPVTGARIPVTNQLYMTPFNQPNDQLPEGITSELVSDPNSLLRNVISSGGLNKSEQKILQTDELTVSANPVGGINGTPLALPSTAPVGGILNIPFINSNAAANSFSATFWIETVENPDPVQEPFLRLQYTQIVILDFLQIKWPHISVATLIKQ